MRNLKLPEKERLARRIDYLEDLSLWGFTDEEEKELAQLKELLNKILVEESGDARVIHHNKQPHQR